MNEGKRTGGRVPPEEIPDAARYLLRYIDPDALGGYSEWQPVFHAIAGCGLSEKEADAWCMRGRAYVPGEVSKRWRGYENDPGDPDSSLGTLFNRAKLYPAYVPYGRGDGTGRPSERTHEREVEPMGKAPRRAAAFPIVRPRAAADIPASPDLDPAGQARAYLSAVFRDGDRVMATVEGMEERDRPGRWRPVAPRPDLAGETPRSGAATLAEQLDRAGEYAAAGTACGGYVVVNPLDGLVTVDADGKADTGCSRAHVAAYRNVLVECDPDNAEWEAMDGDAKRAEIRRQARALLTMNLPIAAMTYSGGKSVHAVVRVDAKNAEEYTERVGFLYGTLKANGFATLDENCTNETRWTRLAGATRGGALQALMGTNMGASDWGEWRRWLEANRDRWAELTEAWVTPWGAVEAEYLDPPVPVPTQIESLDACLGGGLRPGPHIVMGRPGSGKSALALQVAANVALMGGRVLYVSVEMTASQCAARVCSYLSAAGAEGMPEVRWGEWEAMGAGGDPRGLQALARMRVLVPGFAVADGAGVSDLDAVRAIIRDAGEAGASLVVVDYLQRIVPREPTPNAYERLQTVVHGITAAAKAARMPVILVSSMNRESMRAGKASITGAAGCGDIEYDALTVMQLIAPKDHPGNRDLFMTKNRYGGFDEEDPAVTFGFDGAHNRFADPMETE